MILPVLMILIDVFLTDHGPPRGGLRNKFFVETHAPQKYVYILVFLNLNGIVSSWNSAKMFTTLEKYVFREKCNLLRLENSAILFQYYLRFATLFA